MWGATQVAHRLEEQRSISIHAPRVGCDIRPSPRAGPTGKFQSTHPVWGATLQHGLTHGRQRDFNPRTPCGVRLPVPGAPQTYERISIHAPRVGCDRKRPGDHRRSSGFQSTHPVWGATQRHSLRRTGRCDFNPRTPCGVRQAAGRLESKRIIFQSTHPVWGATPFFGHQAGIYGLFQSTHPVWGATLIRRSRRCC